MLKYVFVSEASECNVNVDVDPETSANAFDFTNPTAMPTHDSPPDRFRYTADNVDPS